MTNRNIYLFKFSFISASLANIFYTEKIRPFSEKDFVKCALLAKTLQGSEYIIYLYITLHDSKYNSLLHDLSNDHNFSCLFGPLNTSRYSSFQIYDEATGLRYSDGDDDETCIVFTILREYNNESPLQLKRTKLTKPITSGPLYTPYISSSNRSYISSSLPSTPSPGASKETIQRKLAELERDLMLVLSKYQEIKRLLS
jgi:hypothetical protein